MASPIGYLIHPDPPTVPNIQVPSAVHTAPGGRAPLNVTTTTPGPSVPSSGPGLPHGPASALPSVARPGPGHAPAQTPPENHSKTQSLYQCADCLRRYSRPEHLQRHIAAHTLGKRFTCDVCSKGFARADLLKRHRTNHKDDNVNKRRRFNTGPSASRVTQACSACAKARVKCEETKPCTRCKKRGLVCEAGSSEDAAMYSVHLSGNRTGHDSTPESCYSVASSIGPPHHQLPMVSTSSLPSASPEDTKEGIVTPVYSAYPEAQLPTPDPTSATVSQSNQASFRSYPSHDVDYAAADHTRVQFPDFLRDVLYEQPFTNPRDAEGQGVGVLDFYDDANLDFNDFDFSILDHWNMDVAQGMADQTSNSEDPAGMTAMRSALDKIWTESPWKWTALEADNCHTEQPNLPLPSSDAHGPQIHDRRTAINRVAKDTLHPSCRDKTLAIVLGTCRESRMASRVASSFPSVDMMDSWINIFLAAHSCQLSSWIHYGSFSLNNQWPEFLAVAAAAGAVLTPVPAFRRFGYALQEAIRVAIPRRFDEDSTTIAEIGKVQALVLLLDVGLWSGSRRKMEIAECHLPIPISMMRNRGRFSRTAYPDIGIYPSDEGEVLEEKWKKWYHHESWKRLIFHAYLRDARVSMTQFNAPIMSYAELTLPLPCSRELWFSRTAEEFKMHYLASGAGADGKRPPSLGDLFRDTNALPANHRLLDLPFATAIYLHGFWSLIWEYRQLTSIHASTPANTTMNLLLTSRRQDLQTQLKTFHLLTRQQHQHGPLTLTPQDSLLLHFLHLNLHVSLPDLQLFSGKEGEDQARRVYPFLQTWVESADARRSMWHAGQVFRWARLFPGGTLKEFWGVAVCHAALAVWCWGVVRGQRRGQGEGGVVVVFLDGEEESGLEDGIGEGVVQAWVEYGQGRPAVRGLGVPGHGHDGGGGGGGGGGVNGNGNEVGECCLLEDPRACMVVAQEILRGNFVGVWESLPSLSDNVIWVLKQLEKAAGAVGVV